MIHKSMSIKTIAAGLVAFGLAAPAMAEDAVPDSAGGRYSFSKAADGQGTGYLRLDAQTGEVALCSPKAVGFACEAAPEDRAVLENEIARLQRENAVLKKDLLSRGLPLPQGTMPLAQDGGSQNEPSPSAPSQSALPNVRLPSDADIDRVVDFAGRVWQRFIDAVARAQKQILNKS
jgi:hypothetical protein